MVIEILFISIQYFNFPIYRYLMRELDFFSFTLIEVHITLGSQILRENKDRETKFLKYLQKSIKKDASQQNKNK